MVGTNPLLSITSFEYFSASNCNSVPLVPLTHSSISSKSTPRSYAQFDAIFKKSIAQITNAVCLSWSFGPITSRAQLWYLLPSHSREPKDDKVQKNNLNIYFPSLSHTVLTAEQRFTITDVALKVRSKKIS